MKCFILAGGYATRLWPLTEKRSKPLLPLAGKPLLTHLIEQIPSHMDVTVSTNSAFEEAFDVWRQTLGREVHLLIEDTSHEDHKLGALGALGSWLEQEKIDDDVLVLTGDNYLGFSLHDFLKHFDGHAALLAAHDIGDISKASAFGTVITNNHQPITSNLRQVISFEEKPKEPKTSLISTGCLILPKSTIDLTIAFAKKKPDNVGAIFEELLHNNVHVSAFVFTEPWLDIGSFHSYLAAHRLLVGTELLKAHDSSIDKESVCHGSVSLGEKTTIKRSQLTDCMIFGNCVIEDCVLKDCVIDEGSQLKGIELQGKMLREKTVLMKNE